MLSVIYPFFFHIVSTSRISFVSFLVGVFIDFFVCFNVIKYFYFIEVFSFFKATVMFPLSSLVKIIL